MALFGKKSGDSSAGGTPTATKPDKEKKGGLFGRKKGGDSAPDTSGLQMPGAPANGEGGFDDFSDFSTASSELGFGAAPINTVAPRPKVLNGTSVGLNIGNATIKVVELQSKGGNVSVTGVGSVPTPVESISNGVVMSVGALQHAIREAFKTAGIKSKRVTLSVSGTGSLVVRVIEVPRMSDAELAASMAQDAERYIPFPPSEVIMDYKALRELPSAPDSPNMDVLLAAAQREIIDLNIKVLEEAKLDPRAIEVEPLAVARALSHAQVDADGRPATSVDYARVTAIINIGASGTEISVLRGDVLVFTRIIPNGGNTLSQALVDYLGLPFGDAERAKHELGDALAAYQPPVANTNFGAATTSGEDWSDFGADDFGNNVDASADSPAFTPDASATAASSPTSDDPFADDFFNQGPQNTQQEPREQHGQKQTPEGEDAEPTAFSFDFPDIPFADNNAPADAQEPAAPDAMGLPSLDLGFADESAPSASTSTPAEAAPANAVTANAAPASDFNFDLDAPSSDAPAPSAFSFDFDTPADTPPAPSAVTPDAIPATVTSASDTEASAWSLEDLGLPEETTPATSASATPAASTDAFDFSSLGNAGTASDAGTTATTSAAPDASGDLNFDELFGNEAASPPVANATATDALDFGDFGTPDAVGAGALGAGALGASALSGGFDAGMDDFGVGLSDDATQNVDAATVYSILHPLLDELAGEIRRSLEYHASRYPDAVVQSIDVVGGGAKLTNIDVYLTHMLGIPTSVGNPFRAMTIKNSALAANDAPLYAVATGLALRDLLA